MVPAFDWKRRTAALWPFAVAAAAVLLAAGLRLAADPLAGGLYPFTLYYAVAPLVAWRFGLRAGLFAVVLSVLAANYGLLEPRGALSLEPRALFGSLSFTLIGTGLAWLGDRARRARRQLQARARDLEREIAQRRCAEVEVERLNALLTQRVEELEAMIEASPTAIGIAADPQCTHIRGNRVFADLLGLPGDANMFKSAPAGARLPFKIYRHGVELAGAELPMQYCARHGARVENMEIEILRTDGARRTVLANAAPLHDAAGKVRGSVGVFVDITERKAVEREREEMNRRKDEFLATLAHELRNPLAPLRNAAAILQQHDHPDRKVRWVSDVIERQVQHMARLVDDLLDLARVTRGLITLSMETVELRALVWQAIELVRPPLERRRQRLHVELPIDALRLRVDRVRMTQVFANILGNAVKYTPDGGSILVSARQDEAAVRIKVRDSGAGIPAELLPKIFDVFVQGDRSLARTGGGLGIGLTLVKKLVELHDGTVEASSAGPGTGAEIAVTLPSWQGAATPQVPLAASAPCAPCRILVVDDNPDVADTLAMLLRTMGHQVRAVHTAEAALATAGGFRPGVALLDIGLPDIDGYALAARFRSDPVLRGTRLVALTGYGAEGDRARSAAAGFAAHLTKPYRLEQLEALLQAVTPAGERRSQPQGGLTVG